MRIEVPVSVGELVDKLTILQIKARKMNDPAKLLNVRKEMELLAAIVDRELPASAQLDELVAALRAVNERLWSIEDELRALESRRDFSAAFVANARNVYLINDERARIKHRINIALDSDLVEEKSYAEYSATGNAPDIGEDTQ